MPRELIYSIVITLSVTFVLVTGMRPWVARVHRACFAGHPLAHFRTSWRSRCETNIKPGKHTNLPRYIISSITNAVTKARSKIYFGPNYPNGHPRSIHYNTTMEASDAMSVMIAWNESIFMEATDFGTQYNIEIKTPDKHSASCYHLLNDRSKNLTLIRGPNC